MPRLGFEDEPEPQLPVSIVYAFPEQLVNFTKSVDGCGLPHTIPVGQLVAKSFMKVGLDRFETVRAEPPIGQAQGVSPGGFRIIVELQKFAFDPVSRSGEEDRYSAFMDLNLQATYENSQGIPLAKTPLAWHKNVSLWTPALTSSSASCDTNQIDGTVVTAAEKLALEMVSVLPQLIQPSQPLAPQGPRGPVQPPITTPPPQSVTPTPSPSVTFRTKLVDANRNLILEGGEIVVLLIETTNTSDAPIPSAYVELRGTPHLVEAFERVAPLPVPIGALKPGEKRTSEIRGRLSKVSREMPAELIVGIILSEGLPPGTHTIRATLSPPVKTGRSR